MNTYININTYKYDQELTRGVALSVFNVLL